MANNASRNWRILRRICESVMARLLLGVRWLQLGHAFAEYHPNPDGAERIRGELLKVGIKVRKRTIQKYTPETPLQRHLAGARACSRTPSRTRVIDASRQRRRVAVACPHGYARTKATRGGAHLDP